ncbi:hypothetical protein [Alicyclobacillus acidocaldarius]|uniref:Uncharacterized protein n=1 Tax=Alicyclobacillus acidocaldarius (strain Tc-4-1) TaxID=1048834 RepID=F8IDE7_ALIAT|nr:hypothetical protein [Alicyclobacillus acidocaldarius]AEJ43800.1 hypothetical protein TC41_1884 [Alicyclobacillus acidocaldarius subsp. acidocaldarius Tc-4-1]
MTLPVQFDEELLRKLGLTVQQAQELEANGITLEEYAKLQEEAAQLEAEAEIVPVRFGSLGRQAPSKMRQPEKLCKNSK